MEGVWTFLIPQTHSGGILVARNGTVCGGDECYFFQGTYTEDADSVAASLDVNLVNPQGLFTSAWGDNAEQFPPVLTGRRSGEVIEAEIARDGMELVIPIVLTRRADVP